MFKNLPRSTKWISSISFTGGAIGLLVALVVTYASRLQYQWTTQYLKSVGGTLIITAGYYYRVLATIYFIISIMSIIGSLLIFRNSHHKLGVDLLLETYTIGILRVMFAFLGDREYTPLGLLFMGCLVVTGMITIVMLSQPENYRRTAIIFGSQIFLGVLIFLVVPVKILEPVVNGVFVD